MIKNSKKNIYCKNCSKPGHLYKNCLEPATSYGIITFKFDIEDDFKQRIKQIISDIGNGQKYIKLNNSGIDFKNFERDQQLFSYLKDKIQFLLVRRKHTIGFLEFMRGHYKSDDIDNIIFLFQQMTQIEINRIGIEDFDSLWNSLWKNGIDQQEYKYNKSKELYYELKNKKVGICLNFYVNNVKPSFNQPEWGFPKGRKNLKEGNIMCAMREFSEETGYLPDDTTILKKIIPVEEDMIGTDGKKYIHIYYLGLQENNANPKIDDKNENQVNEVGEIGWFSFTECLNKIRYYHKEKKQVLSQVYNFLMTNIINNIEK